MSGAPDRLSDDDRQKPDAILEKPVTRDRIRRVLRELRDHFEK